MQFCEEHSRCLDVVVKGKPVRYCQVCNTVHGLSDFVGTAKTCEKWLSRRRMQRAARHGKKKEQTKQAGLQRGEDTSMRTKLDRTSTVQQSALWNEVGDQLLAAGVDSQFSGRGNASHSQASEKTISDFPGMCSVCKNKQATETFSTR